MYCAARGPAPHASQFLTKSGLGGSFGPRRPREIDRVIDHVLAGGHLADELLHPENVLALQHRPDFRPGGLRGGHHDLPLLGPRRIADVDRRA